MNWPLGVSTCVLGELTPETFRLCADAGIRCIEYVFPNEGTLAATLDSAERFRSAAFWVRQAGLELWSVHLPFFGSWSIDSTDNAVRSRAVELCGNLLELAHAGGAGTAVIHGSGEDEMLRDSRGRAERRAASRESLVALNDRARSLGIKLAVEALPRACLGNTAAELLDLIDFKDGPGICCDMNHMLKETPVEFIGRAGHKIITVHVSDYDGFDEKHWLPGRGINDWPGILAALERCGYAGPFLYEVRALQDAGLLSPGDIAVNWRKLRNL